MTFLSLQYWSMHDSELDDTFSVDHVGTFYF
jgi:hypothetical protein